ncbi:MAG: protein kinase [Planctomycetia bacterium]|nr:protein kinase [Planctomycetia bacterium]
MQVKLTVTAGPHTGREFVFDRHDTFLVGRSKDAHFQLSYDDPYFSRRHFLMEVNPPRVRVVDLNSRNGIVVNGQKVRTAELNDSDELQAGNTVFRVGVVQPTDPDDQPTLGPPTAKATPRTLPETTDHVSCSPIPGYKLAAEIGRGSMGVVYRASRDSDREPVAVKVIAPAAGVLQRDIDLFLREARIMAELDHRHIVRYLDSGESDGFLYLVMELVDGPDLRQRVKDRGPLDIRAGVRLTINILDGLTHAHAKGFVHRDVKPSNVLLDGPKKRRMAKLADFGLARAYDTCNLSGLTMQGEVGGTPAFMAPEQVTHYRDVKPAADQYSAAATLYYLLTGQFVRDFVSDTNAQLVQIIIDSAAPIRAHRPEISDNLAEVIHKALAREPEDRYPDVPAFRNALRQFA